MAVNKYKAHLLVIPEDDANRQIINGFRLQMRVKNSVMQDLKPAGGWQNVLRQFQKDHVSAMKKYSERRTLLLIDFDNDPNRLEQAKEVIPEDLKERVFILGVLSNPEELKSITNKTFETIGEELADECANEHYELWNHALLTHNQSELHRMIDIIKPFLFSDT